MLNFLPTARISEIADIHSNEEFVKNSLSEYRRLGALHYFSEKSALLKAVNASPLKDCTKELSLGLVLGLIFSDLLRWFSMRSARIRTSRFVGRQCQTLRWSFARHFAVKQYLEVKV